MSSIHKPMVVPKRTLYILVVSLGMGAAFDWLFYGKMPGISFSLYVTAALLAVGLAVQRLRGKVPNAASYLLGAGSALFAWMVFVRGGGFMTFLNVCSAFLLAMLFLISVVGYRIREFGFAKYQLELLRLPIRVLQRTADAVGEMVGLQGVLRKHESAGRVLRGILITLPVLLVFGLLFSSADLVFRKYASGIFNIELNPDAVVQTVLALAVACGFAGVFYYVAHERAAAVAEQTDTTDAAVTPRKSATEATILFGSVNALFFSFILIQLTYLFGGERNVAGQGFTYAQYARKGFFELIAVAVLSLALVLVAERVLARGGQKHTGRFKWLATALVGQVMIIMASAFSRLSLLENAYGFTSLRLYSHLFIVWLAFLFCALLYKIYVDRRESTFALVTLLSALAFVLMLNIVNVDAVVARKNIRRYQQTGKIDVAYLSHLSDDGLAESTRLLDTPDAKIRNDHAAQLYGHREDLRRKAAHWQSANLSRQAALRALDAHADLLERNKNNLPSGHIGID